MKKILFVVIVGAVFIGVANSRNDTGGGAASQPGLAAVYQRIASETDCQILQAQFDQAAANGKSDRARGALALAKISTAYMGAADDRMRAIGCY